MKVKHCPACNGRGEVERHIKHETRSGFVSYWLRCEACNGTGRVKATKPKTNKP